MPVGGSIESVSIWGRTYGVPADSAADIVKGGFSNEFQPNGDGETGREIKTRLAWVCSDLKVSIAISGDDLDYLQDIADGAENGAIVVTYPDGSSRSGTGKPMGEIKYESLTATATLTLSGPGKMEAQ